MLVKLRIPAAPAVLTAALKGVVAVNRVLMKEAMVGGRLGFAPLYDSGVRYVPEPRGSENWQNVADLYRTGRGDCEDLACTRAAELQLQGEDAEAVVRPSGRGRYHALVLRGDGTVEDPSLALGMKGRS